MRVLEVSRYKKEYAEHMLPFVTEQGESLRKAGCEVEYFLVRGNYITAVKPLKEKIREFKPDIAHAHYGLSAITAELQGLVPVVTTFHNGETHSKGVNFIASLFSLRAKHVIYVAQHIYDMVYFKAKNYSIIPCGVSLEDCVVMDKAEARKKLGWDSDKKYIMFGGAFDNLRKNYPLLRSAIEELYSTKTEKNTACAAINIDKGDINKKEESPIRMDTAHAASSVIANQSANEQDSLQSNCQSPSTDANELHLSDSSEKIVDFINCEKSEKKYSWTPVEGGEMYGDVVCVEMRGLSRAECVLRMCGCDVFALPTKNEGSPQALKEAMACNCPIVATDVADIKHLLGGLPGHYVLPNKKGNCAWWKGDEHSAEELAELLKKALAFEGRTEGRKRIVELGYTNELVAKQIIKIYEQILC